MQRYNSFISERLFNPKCIEFIPRQWVVAVGLVLQQDIQVNRGYSPSNDQIKQRYLQVQGSNKFFLLLTNAALYIQHEYKMAEMFASKSSINGREASQLIKDKYEDLETDPQQNFSFLDDLLLKNLET